MSRLTHTASGFLRLMQMSRIRLFVFVEGWSDRNIYDRICRATCEPLSERYEVRTAAELPSGGGKDALLAFFTFLRRRGALLHALQGKWTGILFFLDKDIDDILRIKKRSPHVVYTEFYDLENYVFAYGDLVRAGAAAASLDEAAVHAALSPSDAWRRRAALAWLDWLVLCVAARKRRAPCKVTYRRPSPLNSAPWSPTDPNVLAAHEAILQTALNESPPAFAALLASVRRTVIRIARHGAIDRVFKGKWYKYFLAHDLVHAARGRQVNAAGLEDRLVEMLKLTLDVHGAWASRYHFAIKKTLTAMS
jgi:hypothetical protein